MSHPHVHTTIDHYALRCVSGPLRGQRWPLRAHVCLGRAAEAEITLPEEQVSRRHAQIFWDTEQLLIADLDSTNGTYLNGCRIADPTELTVGDRVLIGVSIFAIEAVTRETSGIMSGRLEAIGFESILQFFGSARRSGILHLEHPFGEGDISLVDGRLMAARIKGLNSFSHHKAFFRMMTWREGLFIFLDGEILTSTTPLDTEPMGMLLEGLRQRDELEAYCTSLGHLPIPQDAVLALPTSMPAPLRDLNPDELDTLQLTHERGSLDAILDASPTNDFETLAALTQLLHQGYIQCL